MQAELRQTCRQLLEQGTVRVVIGYAQQSADGPVHPAFVTRPEDVDQLVWNDRCSANLTTYLVRKESRKLGKAAIVVKGCDARTLVVLEKESQIKRSELVAIGMVCGGLGEPKCETCDAHVPSFTDYVIGGEESKPQVNVAEAEKTFGKSPRPNPLPEGEGTGDDVSARRHPELQALLAMLPAERMRFWMKEFSRCVKCYACRQACPLCYCERCIVDKNRPTAIDTSATLKGNFAWQITRAFHLAGRCVGCDQCTAACPAGIDLRLLNLALAEAAERNFGYRPGVDPHAEPIVGAYSLEDREDFIR